ncbi:U-box domain-containing protein 3-like isoform X3 [Vicia villosa]|nr:U-box domain-containing protein 3-like isoform X3 [Vicia villosa]
MDLASAKCVINSISRFIHLVSCQTVKPIPLQKNCTNMVSVLRCLKPVLDDVFDYKVPLDENLYRECEELDRQVNEAREFVENWSPKTSRVHSVSSQLLFVPKVLQSGELLIMLQDTALRICHIIDRFHKLTSSTSVLNNLQHHMQELKCLKKESTSVYIEEVLRNQKDNTKPSYERQREIIELLNLTSNQDLLKESIAVEKERLNAEVNKTKGELDKINQIVNLVCSLRDYAMKTKCPEVKSDVSVPTYFRCPLSLELMLDPVIVASGQTYQRQSIQTWLDSGLNVCPKTHQTLNHAILIPNYTVKAMIASWCEENNIELPHHSKQGNSTQSSPPKDYLLHQDLNRLCSFGSSHSSNSNSKSSLQTGNAFEKQKGDEFSRLSGEGETEMFEQQSQAHSCSHSRSESFSSSISSTDYVPSVSKKVSQISNKQSNVMSSGEINNNVFLAYPANEDVANFPTVSQEQFQSPGSKATTSGISNKHQNVQEKHQNVQEKHQNVPTVSGVSTKHQSVLLSGETKNSVFPASPAYKEFGNFPTASQEQFQSPVSKNAKTPEISNKHQNVQEKHQHVPTVSGVSNKQQNVQEKHQNVPTMSGVSNKQENVQEKHQNVPLVSGLSNKQQNVQEKQENAQEKHPNVPVVSRISNKHQNVLENHQNIPTGTSNKQQNVLLSGEISNSVFPASPVNKEVENFPTVSREQFQSPGSRNAMTPEISNKHQNVQEKHQNIPTVVGISNKPQNVSGISNQHQNVQEKHQNVPTVSGISNTNQKVLLSGGINNNVFPASPAYKEFGNFPTASREQFQSPGSKNHTTENENNYNNNIVFTSHSSSEDDVHSVSSTESDKLTTAHVGKLIEDLQSQSKETQATAAEELRLLTKHNMENRIIVGKCGAIMHLLPLLYSDMKITQEHAVTAILNLSINEDNKTLIMEAGVIEPLIHVLKNGNNGAKENSAATLFSLSVPENNKMKIGRSGAVKALVELLASGTIRGKKDAATALFNLSIFHENKARIVQAGAVKFLVKLLDPADGMVDKAVALLANLSTIPEGRIEIVRERGIPLLVELVESGSQRGKENAASIVLQLSLHSPKFCTLILQEGAVPPIVALSQFGTPRAKEKAQQLLSHFRSQREGANGRGKS